MLTLSIARVEILKLLNALIFIGCSLPYGPFILGRQAMETMSKPIGNPLTGHNAWVNDVAFSPDGATIISASERGTPLIMWANRSLPDLTQWACDNRYIRALIPDEKIFYGISEDYHCAR